MFSHPEPGPSSPSGPSATAPGEPALDGRWSAATAGWRPSSIRSADAVRVWAWVRHAWEAVVEGTGGPEGADALAAGPDRRVRDLLTVAALFVFQDRFLTVAGGAGDPDEAEVPDPRDEGAPLEDAEVLAVVRQLWEVDPAEEEADGFATELSGFLRDHLDELADDVRERLVVLRGPTQVFAELWSLGHEGEVEPSGDDRAPFPLSTDDIAWIVSGVPGPEKHTAWEWLIR